MRSLFMNKAYQQISDYRLPTELAFREAARAYGLRALIVCAVALSAMAASLLIVLVIVIFQAGYGLIVILVVGWLLFSGGGGGGTSGRSSSGGGQSPPGSDADKLKKQQPQGGQRPAQPEAEKVLVPVYRPTRQKQRMLARDPYDETKPPIVIERDEN